MDVELARRGLRKRPGPALSIDTECALTPQRPCGLPPAMWETLEPRLMFATVPLTLGRQASINQAVALITSTRSSAPIYVPSISNLPGGFTPATAVSTGLISLDDFRGDGRFAGIDGSGFTTVILDTGIDLNHPFFGPDANNDGIADRIVYQYDFANNDNNATDYNGHGSNVSSIVASSDGTYRGMAPGANIIHLKVFTDAGAGNFSYVEKALQWCVANAAAYNIASINMSLGDNANWSSAQTLYGISDELAALAAMDVITVSATGNDFSSFGSAQGVAYPAADPNSLGVGAVYKGNVGGFSYASGAIAYGSVADAITPFTQRHATLLDIMAPGAPITGAGPTGNLVTQHGTSQASPHIAGIAALAQQLATQTIGRKLTLAEFRQLLIDSADIIVDGDDENDNVANTGLTFPRVNVFALGEAILGLAPSDEPEIQVLDGTTNLTDGSSTVNFGTATLGSPIDRTFTVRNVGLQPLDLTSAISLPPGFSLASGFGATTLAPGASTTFTVRLNATATGTFGGVLSFSNTDANESPFNFNLLATVQPWIATLDNSAAGFATTGTWATGLEGLGGTCRYSSAVGSTATWTFTGLDAGQYRVYATWTPYGNRPTAVPFDITDGSTPLGGATVNQRLAPAGLVADGASWQLIEASVLITGGTMVVRLTAPSGGYSIADAIRIERFADLPAGAEITVSDDSGDIEDGGSVDYGSTNVGSTVSRTFTVRNVGQSTLNLGAIDVPAGYTLTSGFGTNALASGASTTFTVRLDALSLGTYLGAISFNTNDADESPFTINVTGSVAAVSFKDDGDAGFALTGAWVTTVGGYGNDQRYSNVAGATATWTFDNLAPGTYRVSVAYSPYTNRAPNVGYTVFNGALAAGSATVNQRIAPADRVEDGIAFQDIGSNFNITGNSLVLRATVPAGGYYLMADAVRIERVGEPVLEPEITVLDGAAPIADGGAVAFGSVFVGNALSRTFTVRNDGSADLTLGGAISVPAGYTVTAGFGDTTLAPGESTTFTVRLDGADTGTFNGTLSFASNDSDEGTFNFTVSGTVGTTLIIDDGDSGFNLTGSWVTSTGGYGTDLRYSNAPGNTATWSFTGLPAGIYRVSTTWAPYSNRSAAVGFAVLDGGTTLASRTLDQRTAPNDFVSDGVAWEDLSTSVIVTNGSLSVRATVPASGYTIADAVRITRVTPLAADADVAVYDGDTPLADGAAATFASTYVGAPVSRTFTVRNLGLTTLSLNPAISVPAGFTVTSGFGSISLATGESTTFTVRMDADAVGTPGGTISFTSNDPDESPFTLAATGDVAAAPVLRTSDNGDAGNSFSGGPWVHVAGGFGNDLSYSNAPGSSHSWIFTGLTPGTYRVLTTFDPWSNRATNVSYAAFDGATLRQVTAINQRIAGNDLVYAGRTWELIGANVNITGTSMTVTMTVPASGYAIADGVYIERMGAPSQANGSVSTTPPRFATSQPIGARLNKAASALSAVRIEPQGDDADFFFARRPSRLAA